MKSFSRSFICTAAVFATFSAGLMACGSGSDSTAGVPGQVGTTNSACTNPVNFDNFQTQSGSQYQPLANPHGQYALSHLTIYMIEPSTGDSFLASSDADDSFQTTNVSCNNVTSGNARTASFSAELLLDLDNQQRSSDKGRISVAIQNGAVTEEATSFDGENQKAPGSPARDFFSPDRTLVAPDTYVTRRVDVVSAGELRVRVKVERPQDQRTGQRIIVYGEADYRLSQNSEPQPPRGRR